MELLKDYDCTIVYHPSKTNVIVDVLSIKSMGSLSHIIEVRRPVVKEFQDLVASGVRFEVTGTESLLAHVHVRSTLVYTIKVTQGEDPHLRKIVEETQAGKVFDFVVNSEGMLQFGTHLCVPNVGGLKKKIIEEVHLSFYPHSSKFY